MCATLTGMRGMHLTPTVLGVLVVLGAGCSSDSTDRGAAGSGPGTAPDSGIPDVSASEGGPPVTHFAPIPAELQPLADGLPTLITGGEADLDGDGMTDIQTTIVDGKRTISVLSFGMPIITVTHLPSGDVEAIGDLEMAGVPTYWGSSKLISGSITEMHAWDHDGDGAPNRTLQTVFSPIGDRETAMMTVTERRLGGSPPTLQVVSQRTARTLEEFGDGVCEGMITRPSNSGSANSPGGRPNVRIITNGAPGACSDAQSTQILDALYQALADGLPCLKQSNPRAYEALNESLAGRSLAIDCGNSCDLGDGTYSIAQTDMPGSWRDVFSDPHMSINMQHFPGGDCAAQVMLHEMLHWAGQNHTGDASGGGGKDQVYACGRFCTKCMTDPSCAIGGGDAAFDCVQCADSELEKELCGTRQDRVVRTECDYRCAEFEHCGVGGSFPAESCMFLQDRLCDGTDYAVLGSSTWLCIASCPSQFPYDCGVGCVGPDATEGIANPCPKPPRCP
jgi:hypothetical protein